MGLTNITPTLKGTMSPIQNMAGVTREASIRVTDNYDDLKNKPQIEGNVLENDKTYEELGLNKITNSEMESILT